MSNQILINVFAQKTSLELLNDLKVVQNNKTYLSLDSVNVIKTILANRELSPEEKMGFENLTVGESFEKIDMPQITTINYATNDFFVVSKKANYHGLEALVLGIIAFEWLNLLYFIVHSASIAHILWGDFTLLVISKICNIVLTYAVYIALKTSLSLKDKMM